MNERMNANLPPILPVGTVVVTRRGDPDMDANGAMPRGSVGTVVCAPTHAGGDYSIRFPAGESFSLRREEFFVLKHYQRPAGVEESGAAADEDLRRHVIYRCVIGSRAYGLEREDSDHDRRGIYLPPAQRHWSLFGVPDQLEDETAQECYWELGRYLELALKANPNVLETLHSPMVEYATPLARELLEMRGAFLSKLVYQTYNGYVMSQFKKLEVDLRQRGRIKWKHAMHLIRLLLAGISILREGIVIVKVVEHRERLLAIRDGEAAWGQVDEWRLALHREFEEAFAGTKLPDRPDYAAVNDFLVKARRSMT